MRAQLTNVRFSCRYIDLGRASSALELRLIVRSVQNPALGN